MKKKTLSLFLVLVMCLSLMPAGVFAQDAVQEQTTEQTETVVDPEQVSEDKAVAALQTMIDDLPGEVTEDNLEEVTAQLEAIEDAMDDMMDEQLDEINPARYEAAVAALAQLGGGGCSRTYDGCQRSHRVRSVDRRHAGHIR